MEKDKIHNPLGEEKVGKLLNDFAVPSIIAMLVSSLYNIVDQFFIGRSIGELGNAATNISFPLSISCIAIALLFGIGGASTFNISMGRSQFDPKEKEKAAYYMGNSMTMLFGCGMLLLIFTQIFLHPLLVFIGSPANVIDYAAVYTRIVSLGFPFLIFTAGGGHLLRADGRPKYTMICNLVGAIINTILDALFVFALNLGMAGAAAATIIGQIISGGMTFYLLMRCKTIKLNKKHFSIKTKYINKIMSLGAAPCTNQVSLMIVQIVMNKSLKYYGSISVYGEAIPIACAGIITKVNQVFLSFIIGISQGLQPIVSYNYGARKYKRIKSAYLTAISVGFIIALISFGLFQFAPRQIISIFGSGSDKYYEFAIKYFKIFLFFTFLNFLQPITSNFFTAISKPKMGIFMSLTRQIIFLLPLLIVLPLFVGIDGIMYAGPIADFLAAMVCGIMIIYELRKPEYKITLN